jgi:hypothetical protein
VTGVGAIFALLASAVIVLGGLIALARSVWNAAQDIRDNKTATQANTSALKELRAQIDGRLTAIETWIASHRHGALRAPLAGGLKSA